MTEQAKIAESIRLEKKRRTKGLTKTEAKRYCRLNSEITGYPEKFFTKEYNDTLDALIAKSDKLIKKLTK